MDLKAQGKIWFFIKVINKNVTRRAPGYYPGVHIGVNNTILVMCSIVFNIFRSCYYRFPFFNKNVRFCKNNHNKNDRFNQTWEFGDNFDVNNKYFSLFGQNWLFELSVKILLLDKIITAKIMQLYWLILAQSGSVAVDLVGFWRCTHSFFSDDTKNISTSLQVIFLSWPGALLWWPIVCAGYGTKNGRMWVKY